jgi:MSHA biogenesis protein MshQ
VAVLQTFTVTVEVRGSDGVVTPNFGNESSPEGIELVASSLVMPASGRNGSANNGAISNASAFSAIAPAGTFTGTQFSWDEYGSIKLQASISDDNYLGVGEITGPESGAVGRFYPAAFALTASSVTAACSGFTYMSQAELALSYSLQAQGTAENKLFNYDVLLLGSSGVSSPSLDLENSNQGTNLNSRLTIGSSSWVNGGYNYSTLIASFNRAASTDGPYTGLSFGVSANDGLDSRLIEDLDMNAAASTACVSVGNCDSKALTGSSQIYYGRLEVSNTFGPETEALDITMNASYFDGSGYVVNSSDDCTGYINTDAALSNYQGGLPVVTITAPTAINLLQNGKTHLSAPLLISAPGAGNTGSVDLTYDAPTWLEFDWNGSGAEDPTGTASFGHFRGHDKVIYWHEVLN